MDFNNFFDELNNMASLENFGKLSTNEPTLTAENYFSKEANDHYVSASQIKAYLACPACFVARIKGEYKPKSTQALLQGSYLDSMFEGMKAQAKFEQSHPEMYGVSGASKNKLKAPFAQCLTAYERVISDTAMAHYCADGKQQVIMTGEVQGVPVKIMIDSLHDDVIIDRKYMADFSDRWVDGESKNWALAWGYDIQGALYQTIVEQNTGEKLPFVLAGVTKQAEPDIGLFLMGEETLHNAMEVIRAVIGNVSAVKRGEIDAPRCETCAYCRATRKMSTDMETWRIL